MDWNGEWILHCHWRSSCAGSRIDLLFDGVLFQALCGISCLMEFLFRLLNRFLLRSRSFGSSFKDLLFEGVVVIGKSGNVEKRKSQLPRPCVRSVRRQGESDCLPHDIGTDDGVKEGVKSLHSIANNIFSWYREQIKIEKLSWWRYFPLMGSCAIPRLVKCPRVWVSWHW